MERYRSGHNEAVLKTVCLHGHGGSNPSRSAKEQGNQLWLPCSFTVMGKEPPLGS